MTPTPKLELPFDSAMPQSEPRLEARVYLEFVEFNFKVLRQNGRLEKMLAEKAAPVDREFSMA